MTFIGLFPFIFIASMLIIIAILMIGVGHDTQLETERMNQEWLETIKTSPTMIEHTCKELKEKIDSFEGMWIKKPNDNLVKRYEMLCEVEP